MTTARDSILGNQPIARLGEDDSSAHLEFMLSLCPAVFYSCGPAPDYATTFISHNVLQRLGYYPSEFYEDPFFWQKMLHPEDTAHVLAELARFEHVDEVFYEYRARHRSGEYVWLRDQLAAIRDASGNVTMLAGCWIDISDRKKAEDALRRSERLASIGTLAAGIAHEINNPITAILLAAQLGLSSTTRADQREQVQQCLEQILNETERCRKIITNVLQFARTGTTEKRTHNLAEAAERAVHLTRGYAMGKGAQVELHRENGPVPCVFNPGQIEQVIVNLIRNSVEAGGTEIRLQLAIPPGGEAARLQVRDNGRGMTAEQCNHLFDPFYTTREREGGSGLGLSIAHGIIADHGGTMDVQSQPGRGTTMTVELPLAPLKGAP